MGSAVADFQTTLNQFRNQWIAWQFCATADWDQVVCPMSANVQTILVSIGICAALRDEYFHVEVPWRSFYGGHHSGYSGYLVPEDP